MATGERGSGLAGRVWRAYHMNGDHRPATYIRELDIEATLVVGTGASTGRPGQSVLEIRGDVESSWILPQTTATPLGRNSYFL